MKNYYDELEVSKTSSKEIISKVYKILAKKYHPDTTKEADKYAAEEKFKVISEAYEVLSDDEKRKKYDLELEQENPSISYEDYINVVKERDTLTNSLNNMKNQFQQSNNSNINNTNTIYNNPQPKRSSKKVKYYNVATGKPVSAFTYYYYKIKQLFRNIGILLLALLAIILAINAFSENTLLNF